MNTAWLLTGDSLHKVDVTNGKTSDSIKLTGLPKGIRDIAVLSAQ
jgi:hypothetical protein